MKATAVEQVTHYINSLLTDPDFDPPASIIGHLEKILDLCSPELPKPSEGVVEEFMPYKLLVISCDASIQNNPGGPAAVGIQIGDRPAIGRIVPCKTNNQAEYAAVYFALETIKDRGLFLAADEIEIRSDSQLVIKQLNREWGCSDPELQKWINYIQEIRPEIEAKAKLKFAWYPRNSTSGLKAANFAAQDLLGVKRH